MTEGSNCGTTRNSSIPDHRQLPENLEKKSLHHRDLSKKSTKTVFGNQKYQIFPYAHSVTYYPNKL
jgi:hypothetical protein